ncbi:Uncharacterized protein dnm_053500 [Desulfonema magnum]|uniref:Uncharacterized protein n=1 Tax=Desulfonema magnum TaxID=45655 RepID=A0A975BPN6_9BACT|nr:Uncharacterized protein dnm_053500 [Desulfonema magnum]
MSKNFSYIFFFRGWLRNPAFSFTDGGSFRKKPGFLPRTNIENLWLGTYKL